MHDNTRRPSLLSYLADCNGSNNSTDKNHFFWGGGGELNAVNNGKTRTVWP